MKGGAYCSRFFNVSEFENSTHWRGSNTVHGLLSTRTVLREDFVNEIKNDLDPALPLCS